MNNNVEYLKGQVANLTELQTNLYYKDDIQYIKLQYKINELNNKIAFLESQQNKGSGVHEVTPTQFILIYIVIWLLVYITFYWLLEVVL